MSIKTIVAIDPDVTESGVCLIILKDNKTFDIQVTKSTFPDLIEMLRVVDDKESGKIVLEAGYKIKSNWHIFSSKSVSMAAEIGNRTGRNHAVGMMLYEVLTSYGYDVIEQKPLSKETAYVKGKKEKVKVSKERLEEILKFKLPRCNQDVRDAVLLAVDGMKKLGFINYKVNSIKIKK